MTTTTTTTTTLFAAVILALIAAASPAHGLGGSATTVAVVYSTATVCGLVADEGNQHIQCWRDGHVTKISPETSFDYIAGGRDTFCAVRSGGFSLLCFNSSFAPKRLYNSDSILLEDLTVGDDQICALTNGTRSVICWRGERNTISSQFPDQSHQFKSISSGLGFSCGVLANKNTVTCWGRNSIMASVIQSQFTNLSMSNIVVGGSHACGFNLTGFLICKGSNSSNLLPDGVDIHSNSAYEYSRLALGANHACAIRSSNGSVVCWGGDGEFASNVTVGVSFESLVAGLNFTCGVTTSDFSIICWGTGWPSGFGAKLGLPKCTDFDASPRTIASTTVNPTQSSPSRGLRKGLLAFAIVGSVGAFSGICTMIYCLWTGVCFGKKKIHNSVQPTITGSNANNGQTSNSSPPSRSSTIRRQGSRLMRRQRSGTSSKHTDRAEEFSFSDLVAATNNFSLENKIGEGSFGVVYRAKLWDGREVAIKRGETGPKTQKFQEKERAFESELAFLSRLHHKHLVSLVGYCEDRDERLLVYEYMKNGALYDHLHKNNVEKSSSLLNSWKMRIKISLDAARGIEYLHNYAVPPIIHRDIKSSNILLDANWTARVSDFGLSLMGPESDRDFRPTKAAGTVGYIDPEYYSLNVLTAKSDVYGLGVVLLELLTGKRAIFKSGENGGEPTRVVDFAVPAIMAGEMGRILDPRVGPPLVNEAEAVELVAYTALHCVNLEGKDRPTMSDVVASLERALALCDDSHGSISSGPISIGSE
ncbi:CRINKLY4 related 3 [Actinidia rufa]|uniref:non-specific serine/threonine protein kinase n=1 Tax=Actinidia rufa TaxID=165716 RepID=A0A7J0EAL3_9ERIC|nr:CRINKLY4 related 3 [Actinidia rufa]